MLYTTTRSCSRSERSCRATASPDGSDCVVTGNYDTAGDATEGLVITGSGTNWSIAVAPLPLPPDASGTNPEVVAYSLACSSVTLCAVAGQYLDASADAHPLLLDGAGASWTASEATAPNKTATEIAVFGVSCYSAGCVAVGSYQVGSVTGEALLETLSG